MVSRTAALRRMLMQEPGDATLHYMLGNEYFKEQMYHLFFARWAHKNQTGGAKDFLQGPSEQSYQVNARWGSDTRISAHPLPLLTIGVTFFPVDRCPLPTHSMGLAHVFQFWFLRVSAKTR